MMYLGLPVSRLEAELRRRNPKGLGGRRGPSRPVDHIPVILMPEFFSL